MYKNDIDYLWYVGEWEKDQYQSIQFAFPKKSRKSFSIDQKNIKDTSFISSLFDRLKTEDNPHIYLKATEVLITFKDKDISRRIVEISKTNPNLSKDWGGKEFTKLLKDNGIKWSCSSANIGFYANLYYSAIIKTKSKNAK